MVAHKQHLATVDLYRALKITTSNYAELITRHKTFKNVQTQQTARTTPLKMKQNKFLPGTSWLGNGTKPLITVMLQNSQSLPSSVQQGC